MVSRTILECHMYSYNFQNSSWRYLFTQTRYKLGRKLFYKLVPWERKSFQRSLLSETIYKTRFDGGWMVSSAVTQ